VLEGILKTSDTFQIFSDSFQIFLSSGTTFMANYSVAFVHAVFSVIVFLFEGVLKSIECRCNESNAFPIFNKCGDSAAGHWKVVAIITPAVTHNT